MSVTVPTDVPCTITVAPTMGPTPASFTTPVMLIVCAISSAALCTITINMSTLLAICFHFNVKPYTLNIYPKNMRAKFP
ncbi:hypothetical protein Barb7_02869 [Bacteroidales bacterium Barb7]|nr:hypothetical protein Barb7_02869 [Bacteroidales bacterium Barb7]